jgi:hypothetical protein
LQDQKNPQPENQQQTQIYQQRPLHCAQQFSQTIPIGDSDLNYRWKSKVNGQ